MKLKNSFEFKFDYRMRAIISHSRFEAALVYKPRILSLKKVSCNTSRSAASAAAFFIKNGAAFLACKVQTT
jgi:hypothetical protein